MNNIFTIYTLVALARGVCPQAYAWWCIYVQASTSPILSLGFATNAKGRSWSWMGQNDMEKTWALAILDEWSLEWAACAVFPFGAKRTRYDTVATTTSPSPWTKATLRMGELFALRGIPHRAHDRLRQSMAMPPMVLLITRRAGSPGPIN